MQRRDAKQKNISTKKGETPERTFTVEETRRSDQVGSRDAIALSKTRGRDFPSLISYKLDKGDSVLNPMADKRLGIKRLEKSVEEFERKKRKDAD
ncbi:hypothetical protein ACFLWJ_01430 [Chloroflexota bacterium]